MRFDVDRSSSYRKEFIEAHPGIFGLYMCAYCGKITRRKNMQVDHVVAVDKVRKSRFYRKMTHDGATLNGLSNMVASCQRCNARKGNKAGIWVIRGKIGPYVWPCVWILLVLGLGAFFVFTCSHPFTHVAARNMILDVLHWLGGLIGALATKIGEPIL